MIYMHFLTWGGNLEVQPRSRNLPAALLYIYYMYNKTKAGLKSPMIFIYPSQIFLLDVQVLLKLLSYDEYCKRDRW
jgi:hypothetical protein